MIPRGATICFVIGVMGAGALGAYLYQVSSQTPKLVYVEGQSLTVIPDKINYRLGQPVHIRVINSGSTPLVFSDSSLDLKIRGLDGTIIYSPPDGGGSVTMSPHQETAFVWNQTKTGGGKIFEGRYKIESNTSPEAGKELKKAVTINIFQ